MSSLMPPENRNDELVGVADDDQAAGAGVDDVVDALAHAVPGATISSALTSRGSCRASSSLSSSPDRDVITY